MLMLKNEIKDIFKAVGLEEFTVGRDSAGHLNIVGPCGKPLVPITNFTIGAKLTKAEREITIEDHIKPILSKYKADILDLIKATEDNEVAKKAQEDFLLKENIDGHLYSVLWNGYGGVGKQYLNCTFNDRDSEYSVMHKLYIDDKTEEYKIDSANSSDLKRSDKILSNIKKKFKILEVIAVDYKDTKKALLNASEKLRTECSI